MNFDDENVQDEAVAPALSPARHVLQSFVKISAEVGIITSKPHCVLHYHFVAT
jgi:hypothetical protein